MRLLPRRWDQGAVLAGFAAALLFAGCSAVDDKPDELPLEVSALPVSTGGIVAAQAKYALAVPLEKAVPRLLAWADLIGSQRTTVCVRGLDPADDVEPQLADALRNSGVPSGELIAALKAWRDGASDRFREVRTMLAEVEKHAPPGVGALSSEPGGTYGAVVFKSADRTILALADVRCGKRRAEAWLLEIHFYVSTSYVAGVNVYHLTAGATPTLTVQLYSWIRQVEGTFGAIARGVAEGKMRSEARATWREVAAYLAQ